jgi:hypothetical protein
MIQVWDETKTDSWYVYTSVRVDDRQNSFWEIKIDGTQGYYSSSIKNVFSYHGRNKFKALVGVFFTSIRLTGGLILLNLTKSSLKKVKLKAAWKYKINI